MALTVAYVIDRIRDQVPNASPDSALLAILNTAHRQISRMVPIQRKTITVSLVLNQRAYVLDAKVLKVTSAYYYHTADDHNALDLANPDVLDKEDPGWRRLTAARPTKIVVQADDDHLDVLLDREPTTTPSGGYPVMDLSTWYCEPLTSGGNMPAQIDRPDAWVASVCKDVARHRYPEVYARAVADYDRAMAELTSDVSDQVPDAWVGMQPSFRTAFRRR
jgi:hypothetical protein